MKKLNNPQGGGSIETAIAVSWLGLFLLVAGTIVTGFIVVNEQSLPISEALVWTSVVVVIFIELLIASFSFAYLYSLSNIYNIVQNQISINQNLLESLTIMQENINLNHDDLVSTLKVTKRTTKKAK